MTQRDWFEVGLRLIGVWSLVDRGIPWVYTVAFGLLRPNQISAQLREQYTTEYAAVVAAIEVMVGLVLLFRADLLTTKIYGPLSSASPKTGEDDANDATAVV